MTNTNTITLTTPTPQLTKSATCLLKTAIATVVGRDLQTEANVLFDEGSQRTFLTEKVASELAVESYRLENISLSSFAADKPRYNGGSSDPHQDHDKEAGTIVSSCNTHDCYSN